MQDALNLFADEPGVAKLCDSLSRWFKNSEKHLAASELMAICRSYPEDLQAPMNASNLGAFIDAWQNCPRDVIENFKGAQETDYRHALDWIFRVIAGIVKAGEGIFNTCDEMNGQLMKTPIYLFDLFCSVARHSLFFIQLFTVPMHFRMHRSQKQFRRLVTSD